LWPVEMRTGCAHLLYFGLGGVRLSEQSAGESTDRAQPSDRRVRG